MEPQAGHRQSTHPKVYSWNSYHTPQMYLIRTYERGHVRATTQSVFKWHVDRDRGCMVNALLGWIGKNAMCQHLYEIRYVWGPYLVILLNWITNLSTMSCPQLGPVVAWWQHEESPLDRKCSSLSQIHGYRWGILALLVVTSLDVMYSIQDWSLQCPSNVTWPFKIYLS